MKKKTVKKNNKKMFVIFFAIVLLLLILLGVKSVLDVNKTYEVESRVATMEKFKKDNSNRQVVGWLKVQGTNIDYPILDSTDEEVGQYENIDYLWATGSISNTNRINTILGHNILNLSANPQIANKKHTRFEQLPSFNYLDFAKENQFVQLTINNNDYVYKIFGVSYFNYDEVATYNDPNATKENVKDFVSKTKENSIFDYNVEVNENDKVISLVTCSRMFGGNDKTGFKVDARLLRKNEKAVNSKVVKNKNYEAVEKRMKGGEDKNEV